MANANLTEAERESLVAYLDGELDKRTAHAIEVKLGLDPNARGEADALRKTWELLDYLPRPAASTDFSSRTIERISAQFPAVTVDDAEERRRSWYFGAGWAASLFLAIVAGYGTVKLATSRQEADTERQLVQDLRIVENLRDAEHVDDIDFLHQIADSNDPNLFGDEDREP